VIILVSFGQKFVSCLTQILKPSPFPMWILKLRIELLELFVHIFYHLKLKEFHSLVNSNYKLFQYQIVFLIHYAHKYK